jgi:integrase
MNSANPTQQTPTGDIREKCQVDDKTEKRRIRSAENTTAYWKARLFKNSFKDREGRTVIIPEWYCRLRHAGVTKRVRLQSADKDQAAEQARALAEKIWDGGWTAVTDRQARLPSSPSVDELCEAYSAIVADLERPPRPITVQNYLRCLRQFCSLAGVTQLRELTPDVIDSARIEYRAKARKQGRPDSAITNSWSKVLRNAAAIFTSSSRKLMARRGLEISENPFAGIEKRQRISRYQPLGKNTLDRIMEDAPKLLHGDPEAREPAAEAFARRFKREHGKNPQWLGFDFRQPHPDVYRALLLAMGCGLRAREIDAARWDWIKEWEGRTVLEIPASAEGSFNPKSGRGRIVPLQEEVHDALTRTRDDLSPYLIGGPEPTGKALNGLEYRSPNTFRALSLWLRQRGVEKGKQRGHPIHALRKEFGSYLASNFGLFHAQAALGHSDPKITSDYYASPTTLPSLKHVRIVG